MSRRRAFTRSSLRSVTTAKGGCPFITNGRPGRPQYSSPNLTRPADADADADATGCDALTVKTAQGQQPRNQSEECVNVNCIMFPSLQRCEFCRINVSTWDGLW